MALLAEKPLGQRLPMHDPAWVKEREALAQKAIDLKFKPRALSKALEKLAAAGDPGALMLMRRQHRYGVSDNWLNNIDTSVHNVCVFAVPEINYKTRKFTWRFGFDVSPSGWTQLPHVFQSAYDMFLFVFMRLIDAGIEKVERCEAPAAKKSPYEKNDRKCGNYFFSKSNRKWCSTTCQVRVTSRRASEA